MWTSWKAQTPRFETSESFNPQRRKLCTAAVVQQIYIEVCRGFITGFIEAPLCAGVSGSHVFVACMCFLALASGRDTSKWAGDLYLTACAKIFLLDDCFLPPPWPQPPPTPPILPMFSSFMALFVYIHSGWKSQTQEDAARNKAALSLSSAFPFLFFPHWNAAHWACFGFLN